VRLTKPYMIDEPKLGCEKIFDVMHNVRLMKPDMIDEPRLGWVGVMHYGCATRSYEGPKIKRCGRFWVAASRRHQR
jgi:hypothetical protein